MNEIEKMQLIAKRMRKVINDDDLSLNAKTIFSFISYYTMMSREEEINLDADFISLIFGLTEKDLISICQELNSKGCFGTLFLEVENER